MAVESAALRSVDAGSGRQMRSSAQLYSLYGLTVRSEIDLPLTPRSPRRAEEVHLEIRREVGICPPPDGPEVTSMACSLHGADSRVHRGPGGTWIWYRGLGTCHISPDLRRANFYIEDGADPRALGLVASGQVMIFVLQMTGRPSLHGSGVVIGHGAVVFLGPSGRGKSTMVAGFLQDGAAVLCDDALPIGVVNGVVWAQPGIPFIKIWRDTAKRGLHIDRELPDLVDTFDKKMLRLDAPGSYADRAVPIRAVYFLSRYDPRSTGVTDVHIQPKNGRDSMAVLLAQTASRSSMLPHEEARLLPIYTKLIAQAPVRVLSFPEGFEHQAAVRGRVLADVAGLP